MRVVASLHLAVVLAFLAGFVWRSRPRHAVNRWFAFFTAAIAGWVLGLAGLQTGSCSEAFGRITFASASLIPAAFFGFTRVFPIVSQWPSRHGAIAVCMTGVAFAVVALATPLIIHDVRVSSRGLSRTAGSLYPFFAAYFLGITATGLTTFIVKWRATAGLARVQLQYLGTGLLIATAGGLMTNLMLPWVAGRSEFADLGPYFVLPLVALAGYAIVRHRLLDLQVTIGRAVAFGCVVLVVTGCLVLLLQLVGVDTRGEYTASRALLVLLLVVAVTGSAPVARPVARVIDSYLFHDRLNLERALNRGSRRLSRLLTAESVAEELRTILESAVAPEWIRVITTTDTWGRTAGAVGGMQALPRDPVTEAAWQFPSEPPAVSIISRGNDHDGTLDSVTRVLKEAGAEIFMALGRPGLRMAVVLLGPRKARRAYLAPMLDFLGGLAEVASVVLETAELHRRELILERERERLAHLVRVGCMYAEFAHEIRTPLSTIANLVAALPERIDDPDYRDLLSRVAPGEIHRITSLADRLHSLGSDAMPRFTEVTIDDVLAEVAKSLKPTADSRRVQLAVQRPESGAAICADPDGLVQLFRNLLSNAIEASPFGGQVVLRHLSATGRAVVQILDEGPGVHPAVQARLFEPFVSTKSSGRGLGLSICLKIAAAHGASVSVRDRDDGPGTVAEVIFNIHPGDGRVSPAEANVRTTTVPVRPSAD